MIKADECIKKWHALLNAAGQCCFLLQRDEGGGLLFQLHRHGPGPPKPPFALGGRAPGGSLHAGGGVVPTAGTADPVGQPRASCEGLWTETWPQRRCRGGYAEQEVAGHREAMPARRLHRGGVQKRPD